MVYLRYAGAVAGVSIPEQECNTMKQRFVSAIGAIGRAIVHTGQTASRALGATAGLAGSR
jgi:hypothetical protein